MGFLRLWLAIAVVLEHAGQGILGQPLNGNIAVSSFYVISGFYIQLIISEKYAGQPNWIRNFYASRALRIYPLYFVFLALSLPMALQVNDVIAKTIATGNFGTILFVFVENIFIFGQDIGRFFKVELPGGALRLIYGPLLDRQSLSATSLPILGQAWSLAVEFGFYLLAPFLLIQKTRIVIAIALCSVAVRYLVSYNFGTGHYWYLWNTFLPSEIATFLLGSLGYRCYKLYLHDKIPNKHALFFLAAILIYSISYRSLEQYSEAAVYAGFLLLIALAVPFMFAATRRNSFDRFVGELSYPVYLGHLYVIQFIGRHAIASPDWLGPVSAVAVTLMAIPLVKFLEEPIARFRERHFAHRTSTARIQ